MRRMMLLALWLLVCAPAGARTYKADDLLKLESFGHVLLTRIDNAVIFERRRPYDEAADYSYHYFVRRQLSTIRTASADAGGRSRALFPQEEGAGYWIGALSPGGHRLSVFRLRQRELSVGIVDLASGSVRWLPQRPDLPLASPAPVWVDDDRLLLVAMVSPRLPLILSLGNARQTDLPALWHAQAGGRTPSVVSVSSVRGAEREAALRRLVLVDVASGRGRTLDSGNITDVIASPDRRRVAVLFASDPAVPPPGAMDTTFIARRHRVAIVDMSGVRQDARGIYVEPRFLVWNPAGDRVLAAVRERDRLRYVQISTDGIVTPLGGSAQAPNQDASLSAAGGWIGEDAFVLTGSKGPAPWMAVDAARSRASPLPAKTRLVRFVQRGALFLSGGRLRSLTDKGLTGILENVVDCGPRSLDPHGRGSREALRATWTVAITSEQEGRFATLIDPAGRPSTRFRLGTRDQVVAAAQASAVVFRQDVRGVGALVLIRVGKVDVTIARNNLQLADVAPMRRRRLVADVPGYGEVASWLYLPPVNAAPLPLVVIPYPGHTYGREIPDIDQPSYLEMNDNVGFLVAAGFAVLRPGMPRAVSSDVRGAAILSQVDGAVDAAVATGLIDARRIGALGHSFGGYAVMSLGTMSKRYRAIVASDGVYDLLGNHGSMAGADSIRMELGIPYSNTGWTEAGQGGMNGPPENDLGRWVAESPARRIASFSAPLMLVHGEMDSVPLEGAERLFVAMARLGKDVTLARYYGEGHALFSPSNIRDYFARVVAFFETNLKASRPSPPGEGVSNVTATPSAKPRDL